MKTAFASPWPRRAAPLVLGALIAAGALLLLSLVLELQEPVWSRPAIVLQLLAIALASAALRAQWPLSRRFVIYPLILVAVIYLWDTTLPPPSLPDGLLRGVAPRLALLGLVIDVAVWHRQRRGILTDAASWRRATARRRPASLPSRPRVRVRRGLVLLHDAAEFVDVSVAVLRARVEHMGGLSVWEQGQEHIRLDDLLQVLEQWSALEQHVTARTKDVHHRSAAAADVTAYRSWQLRDVEEWPHVNGHGLHGRKARNGRSWLVAPQPADRLTQMHRPARRRAPIPSHATLPRYLLFLLGVGWLVLTAIVAIPPGIELRLIADGHAPSAAIFACLQPWVGWIVGGAALLDFLTCFIAVWVLPMVRRTVALAIVAGTLVGVALGLLNGIPCV